MTTKRFLTTFLAALALNAQAGPIVFFDTLLNVTAVAASDGVPGFDSWSSPPTSTPTSASADSVGDLGIAVAGAIAGPGLLTTSADASTITGIATATATTSFRGFFLNDGPMKLNIDFSTANSTSGSGEASTWLFVLLVSDGITLFEDFVSGTWGLDYTASAGSVAMLDLTLTSEAMTGYSTEGFGTAGAFGVVSFGGGTVPTPGTLMLFLTGLGCLVFVKRNKQF